MNYLYGASVQGIQGFIYETGVLKEIVGASELVDSICTARLDEFISGNSLKDSGQSIEGAAGKIKRLYSDYESVSRIVLGFPKFISDLAPGITLNQAVVCIESGVPMIVNFEELEKRLIIARNEPWPTSPTAFSVVAHAPRTGKAAVKKQTKHNNGTEFIDAGSAAKLEAFIHSRAALLGRLTGDRACLSRGEWRVCAQNGTEYVFPSDISEIADPERGFIAIIHADGNGMGAFIKRMFKAAAGSASGTIDICEKLSTFSRAIDTASRAAVQAAFEQVVLCPSTLETANQGKYLPVRPLVISGDDLTVIIRADLAIPFADIFMTSWESATKRELQPLFQQIFPSTEWSGFTVCAGIAFIKPTYPFKYAYELAESLCSRAKAGSKSWSKSHPDASGRIPPSLMFHRERSSFGGDYEETANRELVCGTWTFSYGPYGLDTDSGLPSLDALSAAVNSISNEDASAFRSGLREWYGLIHDDESCARFAMERFRNIMTEKASLVLNNFECETNKLLTARAISGTEIVHYGKRDGAKTLSPVGDVITLLEMGM